MLNIQSIINLTGNRNKYIETMDRLAEDIFQKSNNKVYSYNFHELVDDTGYCSIESITYDRLTDTFIYCIRDCDTGHIFVTDRCNICMIDIGIRE